MLRLHHQETPSRILRRIREAENDSDMPSLPSMASTDGNEDGHDDGDEDDDAQSAVKPRRSPLADMSSTTSSASPAGREFQSKSHQHQNNTDRARNILSPLKLNGSNTRQSPLNTQVNSKLSKGKGKAPASFDESPKVRSPGGPLSAISSNRTVRPTSQSPHDFRANSVTPSVHVTSRANRPSRRTQALSFEESLPEADHSSQQHQQQSHEVGLSFFIQLYTS